MNYAGEQNRDRSRETLRKFTGRHAMSVKETSAFTRISENQINADRDVLREGSIPSNRMRAYGQLFGAAFWSEFIGIDGFAVFETNRAEICKHHLLTQFINYAHTHAAAVEDDHIDRQEQGVIVPLIREVCSSGLSFADHLERRVA